MKTPESYEKADIDAYLESLGAYVVKPTTMGYGKSGAADRVVCIDGMFWSIEVKRKGKEPTPIQLKRIEETRKAGGMAAWGTARKVTGEIDEWLRLQRKRGG